MPDGQKDLAAVIAEMRAYPRLTAEFHSGDREPGTLAEAVARKRVNEWANRLALLLAEAQRPCVCQIEDGLVREWVMKARAVAKSKGYELAALPETSAIPQDQDLEKNDDGNHAH